MHLKAEKTRLGISQEGTIELRVGKWVLGLTLLRLLLLLDNAFLYLSLFVPQKPCSACLGRIL